MNVTVIGTGYVGLVTGACLADAGNNVFCLDLDENKIARLNRGEIPIFEPGLEPIVKRNEEAGRLRFSTDVPASVAHGELQLIAVGTPDKVKHAIIEEQKKRHLGSDFTVVSNPEFLKEGAAVEDFMRPDRIIV